MTCYDDFSFDKSYLIGSSADEFTYDTQGSDLEPVESKDVNLNSNSQEENLIEFILLGLDMEKYYEKFNSINLSLDTFLNLKDSDLLAIGIEDENDRNVILKNLESHRRNPDKYCIVENRTEDLIIAKNILNQLDFMQKYAALVEYKWMRKSYRDLEGNQIYPPARCLQILADRSLVQCKNTLNLLYGNENSNNLIGSLSKIYKIPIPKFLSKKMASMQKRKKIKYCINIIIPLIGIPFLTFVTVKCFREIKKNFF